MAFRSRGVARRGIVTGARRKTLWLQFPAQTAPQALAANTTLLFSSLNAAALALRPFTVIRTVGSVFVSSDQQAASEAPFGSFGLVVVSDQAIAAGAASIPDAYTDNASDWLLHRSWGVQFVLSSAVGIANSGLREFMFDQKGQRKVDIGQDLALMFTNASSANGGQFLSMVRILLKLH